MGIFDFFKNKKQSPSKKGKALTLNLELKKEPINNRIYSLAHAIMKYEESKNDYKRYKKELLDFGFDDSQIIYNTIGLILKFYYESNKIDTLKLYKELDNDYSENEDVTWLFIEVICTINIENDQEFVQKYLNYKRQKHDFNHHYQVEYQKGLELKSKNYFKEAIELWTSLNKIQEFSWNYYQIGILQNLMDNENCLKNLKKGIEMDNEIKEDAKSYPELDNLRNDPRFLKMLE